MTRARGVASGPAWCDQRPAWCEPADQRGATSSQRLADGGLVDRVGDRTVGGRTATAAAALAAGGASIGGGTGLLLVCW